MKYRWSLLGFVALALLAAVAACSPQAAVVPPTVTATATATAPAPPTPTAVPSSTAAIAGTVAASTPAVVGVATGVVATVVPGPLPPGSPFPTMTPLPTPAPGSLSIAELKYRILARFGNIFFCDPDYFPVAREITPDEIASRVAQIQKNPVLFQAILSHLGIAAGAALTPEQMAQVYAESKKLNAIVLQPVAGGYQFTIRVGKEPSGTAITGVIDPNGSITVTKQQSAFLTCPICLTAGTRIATPLGDIPVQALRPGMAVWTTDGDGGRRIALVRGAIARPYSANALLVQLSLRDGRVLLLSPAHPLADGRAAGSLLPGAAVGDSTIAAVDWVPSVSGVTYDILPSGPTGQYWANGVLLRSTLGR